MGTNRHWLKLKTSSAAMIAGGAVCAASWSMLLAEPPSATAQEAEQADGEKNANERPLPTADEILDRYIEVTGGEAAIRKHSSRTMIGTLDVPAMGLSGTMKSYTAEPNLYLLVIEIPGMGMSRVGFDGEIAWSSNQMQGPMLLEDEQLEQIRREADFYSQLNYRRNYPTIKTVGRVDFDGQPCHKVSMLDRSDNETVMYFSVDSGLVVGMETTNDSPMGEITSITTMSDYETVDGVKLPKTMKVSAAGFDQMMKVTSISHDAIDREIFELPAEIKALLASSREREAAESEPTDDDTGEEKPETDDGA